jgi:hypothetical protein
LNDNVLISKTTPENFSGAGIDNKVVGVDGTGDDGFTKAGASIDDGLTTATGEWVGSEEDACHRGLHHLLDDNSKAHGTMVNAVTGSIANGTISPQRGPTTTHGIENGINAHDVKVGVLLPGKAGEG